MVITYHKETNNLLQVFSTRQSMSVCLVKTFYTKVVYTMCTRTAKCVHANVANVKGIYHRANKTVLQWFFVFFLQFQCCGYFDPLDWMIINLDYCTAMAGLPESCHCPHNYSYSYCTNVSVPGTSAFFGAWKKVDAFSKDIANLLPLGYFTF